MLNYKNSPLLIAYVLMLVVMMVLPYFSVDSYSILRNTTSHLGAQDAPNGWIMNVTFALLGLATLYEGWKSLGGFWFQKLVITAFAIGMIMTGVFSHAPIVEGVAVDAFEDQMHSLFASIVGFSFILFAVSVIFIETEKSRRIVALSIGVLSMVLSILIFTVPDLAGIWQRIIFTVTFGWLIWLFHNLPLPIQDSQE